MDCPAARWAPLCSVTNGNNASNVSRSSRTRRLLVSLAQSRPLHFSSPTPTSRLKIRHSQLQHRPQPFSFFPINHQSKELLERYEVLSLWEFGFLDPPVYSKTLNGSAFTYLFSLDTPVMLDKAVSDSWVLECCEP